MSDDDQTDQLSPREALLMGIFGLDLLAYLCAVDVHVIRKRLEGEAELHEDAETVLQQSLVPLAQHVAAQRAESDLPLRLALEFLGRPSTESEWSLGNVLRMASGGDGPDSIIDLNSLDDPVLAEMTRVSLDVYPVLLAPKEDHWPTTNFSMWNHPRRRSLQEAVESDHELRNLFPEEDPNLGRRGYYYSSLGHGGTLQSAMFGELLLGAAWRSAKLMATNPTPHIVLEELSSHLRVLREAAAGGSPSVRNLVAFTGFVAADQQIIDTAWGPLRPLTAQERDLAPPSLEGSVTGTDTAGKQVTVSYAGELVLETEVPYRLLITPTPEVDEPPSAWPTIEGSDAQRRRIDGLQLATLLAIDRPPGQWVSARPSWAWTADPLRHGPSISWWDPSSSPGFMPYEMSAEDGQRVAVWSNRIEASWTPRINIAVTRVLRAVNSRTDMADRLVDAVIAWENLFGTSQGEPRLRVPSAMAWLLRQDFESRDSLRKELRDLYDSRSRIVHGGLVEQGLLASDANEALEYALETLRALLKDRPDILGLANGAARSVRLILGG